MAITFAAMFRAGLRACDPVRWHKCLHAGHCACELSETRIGGEPMLPPVIFSLSIKIVKFTIFNQISHFIISNQISLLNILQFLSKNPKILITLNIINLIEFVNKLSN